MALRRAEQRRPREDEINAVERRRQEEEGQRWADDIDESGWWRGYDGEAEVDLDAVGKGNPMMKCLRCGGIKRRRRRIWRWWNLAVVRFGS